MLKVAEKSTTCSGRCYLCTAVLVGQTQAYFSLWVFTQPWEVKAETTRVWSTASSASSFTLLELCFPLPSAFFSGCFMDHVLFYQLLVWLHQLYCFVLWYGFFFWSHCAFIWK